MIKVAIVEDEKSYNMALQKIVKHAPLMACVGQFYNGADCLEELPALHPTTVLMDIRLPDFTGIELVKKLKPQMPETQFIMCTSFDEDEYVFQALRAGASGYLLKGESMNMILDSIIEVNNGAAPMSNQIARKVLAFFREKQQVQKELETLSKTEYEVLQMLAKGMLYKEVADYKFVTIDTIKKHVGKVYKKLHVSNKVEAINKYNNQ